MAPETVATLLSALAVLLTTIFGGLSAWLLHKRQKPLSDADTADKYQMIADRAASRALRLEARIERLELENVDLNKKYQEVSIQLGIYKDWVERLVHQVRSLGHEPVPKKERTPNG